VARKSSICIMTELHDLYLCLLRLLCVFIMQAFFNEWRLAFEEHLMYADAATFDDGSAENETAIEDDLDDDAQDGDDDAASSKDGSVGGGVRTPSRGMSKSGDQFTPSPSSSRSRRGSRASSVDTPVDVSRRRASLAGASPGVLASLQRQSVLRESISRPPPPMFQGMVLKRGQGFPFKWRNRYIAVQNGSLRYYEKAADRKPKGEIPILANATVDVVDQHIVRVRPGDKDQSGLGDIMFSVDDEQLRTHWVDTIRANVTYARAV
jgi:PH domain